MWFNANSTQMNFMKRFTVCTFFFGLLTVSWLASNDRPLRAAQSAGVPGITGEGKMRFRLLFSSSHLPAEAAKVLTGAHGGFAVDRRIGKGETYFSLKDRKSVV